MILAIVMALTLAEEDDLVAKAIAGDKRALQSLSVEGTLRALKLVLAEPPKDATEPLARWTFRVGDDAARASLCAATKGATKGAALATALGKGALTACVSERLTALLGSTDAVTESAALDALVAHKGAVVPLALLLPKLDGETLIAFRALALIARHNKGPLAAQRRVLAHAEHYAESNPTEGLTEEHWLALRALSGKDVPRSMSAWKKALASSASANE